MITLKSGQTATRIRGTRSSYIVTISPTLLWVITMDNTTDNITDVDLDGVIRDWKFRVTFEVERRYRTDEGSPTPGWWLNEDINPASEPYANRNLMLTHLRAAAIVKDPIPAPAPARILPNSFDAVTVGQHVRFATRDTGFGGVGIYYREGVVTSIGPNSMTLKCGGTQGTARINRRDWWERDAKTVTYNTESN